MKKCIVAITLVLVIIIAAAFLKPSYNYNAADDGERIRCITQYGWKIEEKATETAEVIIPHPLDDVYEKYNTLQKKAGFDISKYSGKVAKRYTYKVLNHKNGDGVYANILVYDGKMIAADIMTRSVGGFMHEINRKEFKD